jgi:VWFA-related protein
MIRRAIRGSAGVRAIAATTVCCAAASWGLTAQQPPADQPPAFRTGVDVVQVDVSVLDKNRRPVRGLTAADFTVLEDGKPRPVVAFVPVELAEPPVTNPGAPWLRDVFRDVLSNDMRPEGRLVVIMFDWSIRNGDQQLARRIAAGAVDQLGPGDLAAVVFSSAFANSGTPQNFTADRSRLLAAINRPFALALHNPPIGPAHDPRNGNEVMIDDPEGYESGDCLCRACVPDAITRVADALRDVPGRRKTLLFIGTYFRSYESAQGPVSRPPPGPPATLTGIVRPSVNTMNCTATLKDSRQKMVRATSLANLTIHTLDPVGIETTVNSPLGGSLAGIRERQADLAVPADLTGGRTVMNTEAPERQLPALFAESHAYYLVAFSPEDPRSNGKYHRIDVRVSRPDVTVRTRAGYYAGERRVPGNVPSVIAPETAAAIGDVLPRGEVPLTITAAPFAVAGGRDPVVAVTLGVRQAAPRDAEKRPVNVLIAAFDRNGKSVQSQTQSAGVTWRPDASGTMRYEILSRLPLKPGRYEIRAAVDVGPNQRGSVYTYVEVPDFARQPLSLSGIVLSASPEVLTAPRDAFASFLPLVPSTMRQFGSNDRATAFLRVYRQAGAPPEPVNLTARVNDSADRVVATGESTLPAGQVADQLGGEYRFDLPLRDLAAGEYLLTIEAARGQDVARRGVRFSVK